MNRAVEHIEILFRDRSLAVINKPAGVSLLADRSGEACLWDLLPDVLGAKPHLVHRLDKPTSGVLLIALTEGCQKQLTRLFQQRRIGKYYLAWVAGHCPERGRIDLPLKKGRKSRYRVAGNRADIALLDDAYSLLSADSDGKPSETRFRTLQRTTDCSLIVLKPLTGRTHQLRVHLSWIGYPILGDRLYGKPDADAQQAPRLQLHAHRVAIPGKGSYAARHTTNWITG